MLRTLIITCFLFSASLAFAQKPSLSITSEKVELILTEKTSETQLKKIQKQLKDEVNIDFAYSDLIVNSKKQLSKISIKVNLADKIKGEGTLLISNLYEVGFILTLPDAQTKTADNPLIIGNLYEKEIKLD